MVGDLRPTSALRSHSNKNCRVQQISNSSRSPEADQKDNNNQVDVNIGVGGHSVDEGRGCGSLVPEVLKDPQSAASSQKKVEVAMPRGPSSEPSEREDQVVVQRNTSISASENNNKLESSKDSPLADAPVADRPYSLDTDEPDGYIASVVEKPLSRTASDVAAPPLSMEKNPKNIDTVETDQEPKSYSSVTPTPPSMETNPRNFDAVGTDQEPRSYSTVTATPPSVEKNPKNLDAVDTDEEPRSRAPSSRLTRALPHSNSLDKSKLLPLVENQELQVPSVEAGNMPLPQMPSRISPAMMGRRHSMDSNIGRSRPPTFVRTYREVKWKRVSKPPKIRQIPRTSSTGNLAAAATATDPDGNSESREYITGTHIIRQRVPIFMTSGEPPDPMGRRFSAGDLIPLTGTGQHWAPNGKCLVIRDRVHNRISEGSTSDDSGSSSSSPVSSSEDVGSILSSEGRLSSTDRDDNCEFSLIDEDDEENEDSSEDGSGEDEEGENCSHSAPKLSDTELNPATPMSSSSTDTSPALSKKRDGQKTFDLRRQAFENALQQITSAVPQPSVSDPATFPQAASEPTALSSFPALIQSTSEVNQRPVNAPDVLQSAKMSTGAHMSAVNSIQPTLATSTSEPTSTAAALHLPLIPISEHLAALSASPGHPLLASEAAAVVPVPALSLSSGAAAQLLMTPPTLPDILSLTGQSAFISSISNPTSISLTVSLPAAVDGKPSSIQINFENIHDTASRNRELNPELSHERDTQCSHHPFVPRPSSPYEMPWVLTSTKIADANVYVSSSCQPESHTSVRSAHWISPRNVEGTMPIHLDDSKAIRVETVSVPTTSGDETLQFQKVSYSSGFIISSAQWVAPTEVKESGSSKGVKTVPAGQPVTQQTHSSHPSLSPQNVPAVTGVKPLSKKTRRKYVPQKTSVLSISELHADLKPASHPRRDKPKVSVISAKEDLLSDQDTVPTAILLPRKLKRNFKVERILIDPLLMLESDLCAQLHSPAGAGCTSPAITKKRFVVEKVEQDSLSSNIAAVKDLSSTFNFVPTPFHRTQGFVLKDLIESAFKSRAEVTGPGSPLCAASEETGKVLHIVSPETADTASVALCAFTDEDSTHSEATSRVSDTELKNAPRGSEQAAESSGLKNALKPSEHSTDSTELKNSLSESEQPVDSNQLKRAISITEAGTESTYDTSSDSESSPAVANTLKSTAVLGTETAADNSSEANRAELPRESEPPEDENARDEASVADITPTADSRHGVIPDTQPLAAGSQPVTDGTQCRSQLEALSVTSASTETSSLQETRFDKAEHLIPVTSLDQERKLHHENSLPSMREKPAGPIDTIFQSQTPQNIPEKLQEIPLLKETPSPERAKSESTSETPTVPSKSTENSALSRSPSNETRSPRVGADKDDDDLFAKENEALLQIILSTLSEDKALMELDNNLCGGSTVAIDNKIEQAMDLVKRHLMYAVREEVEILKQQIGEMMERIGQLEYENSILRSEAKPETLNKLQQPRLPQPPQPGLPSQPQPQTAPLLLAPAPQHPAIPQVQLPQQQQPTAVPQTGQPPSTT